MSSFMRISSADSERGRNGRRGYYRLAWLVALIVVLATAMVVGANNGRGAPVWPSDDAVRRLEGRGRDTRPAVQLVVDTDAGVDDAAALIWLLSDQRPPVEILGITTVAGNTTVDQVTNNVLTVLDVTGRTDIPVTVGAAAPLVKPHSHTGMLVHGPDGFWFVGLQHPHDLSGLPTDVPAFYRDAAVANPGATLLALGPLTNVAQAIAQYPTEMALYEEIIVLGGAKFGGNSTPVAEYNIWQDPEAAEQVLNSGLPVTLVLLDAFSQFTLSPEDIDELATNGTAAAQFLAGPLGTYAGVQFGQGEARATIPDVAAAIYAVSHAAGQPNVGAPESSLTRVVTQDGTVRGQTIVALTLSEHITLIADEDELSALADQVFSDPNFDFEAALGAILAREPDNALVLRDIDERRMHREFMRLLTE